MLCACSLQLQPAVHRPRLRAHRQNPSDGFCDLAGRPPGYCVSRMSCLQATAAACVDSQSGDPAVSCMRRHQKIGHCHGTGPNVPPDARAAAIVQVPLLHRSSDDLWQRCRAVAWNDCQRILPPHREQPRCIISIGGASEFLCRTAHPRSVSATAWIAQRSHPRTSSRKVYCSVSETGTDHRSHQRH